ncbi:hypothetical protein H8L32_06855 [Undibacterium sp. CY18W]|uniref:Orphan protein n=1 Tax=Undibacterium hunanense TaxID=2762292 RepID=A0ABR6ZNM7_9BURK|nr:phosphoribosyltransferase family protein [Undibacterium hunanense]MBC3917189.1 hypothetical protein [Undibacterium hunanense]
MLNLKNDPHEVRSRIMCLEEISSLPLRFNADLYRHYPGMKLGQWQQIDFFSKKLSCLAANIMQQDADTDTRDIAVDWVITAPAFYHLPSAANLLARRVHALLQLQGFSLSLLEPRLNQQQIAVNSQDDFDLTNNYSKSQLAQRVQQRQKTQAMADSDVQMKQFCQRKVITINDIYVTGTQQYFMQQTLDAAAVKDSYWLYIFKLENGLARRHPEIEFEINQHGINDIKSFAAILNDEQTTPTTRCLSRLFAESMDNFYQLISLLEPGTKERIFSLAQAEKRYLNSIFEEKMQLLTIEHQHH